ncbi:hypothetical protein PVL29_003973 [Vitis rotundifolia]|uniref:LOB domain-containing protein n=1 Tax=Vitis rotundifolia TaxID=103349 RepID=A0AA39A7Q3_VITRO|nr:hypothetical protein PVL29_003973 [Vitis rotundifolia]
MKVSEPSAAAGRHGSQACAACKYQRRKCKPDCPLAPFFPSHDKERFRNVHRLFGVANVTKTLQEIPPAGGGGFGFGAVDCSSHGGIGGGSWATRGIGDASAQCETTSFVSGGQSSMDECEGAMEVSDHGGLSLGFNSSRFGFFV